MMGRVGSAAAARSQGVAAPPLALIFLRRLLSHSSAALRSGLRRFRASGAFSREILAENFLIRNSVHHNNENVQKISVKAPEARCLYNPLRSGAELWDRRIRLPILEASRGAAMPRPRRQPRSLPEPSFSARLKNFYRTAIIPKISPVLIISCFFRTPVRKAFLSVKYSFGLTLREQNRR